MSIQRLGLRAGALAVVSLAAFASASSASVRVPLSGWNWGNPAPQGNSLKAVDFTGGRGYAVGTAGTALRSDDGGLSWSGLATGTAGDLTRLQIIDPDTVVILGGGGCVLRRTDDGGKTFKKIFIVAEVNCPDRVQAVNFVNKTTGYLLLADGSVLRTTDSGDSFGKQTAIPGTAASATPGGATAKEILPTGLDSAIAFASPSGGGNSAAYFTTDAGVSWKPLTIPAGSVDRLYRFNATTIFAIGAGTLLRSDDNGATFTKQAFGAGQTLTSIGCADANLCLITTAKGELNRTTDGGATATPITASSVPLAGASFASVARAIAVGAAGQTVISDDGGINYTAIGGDIGGAFNAIRRGPLPTTAFAPGAKGQIAFTVNAGASWKVANVSTSADILDTSWADAKTGYALDVRGGLFRTLNSGVTWQTLNAGAGAAARAVIAVPGSDSVLLFGPKGIKRATGGGEFNAIAGNLVSKTAITNADLGGSAIFAWAVGGKRVLTSANKGQSWKAVTLPSKKTKISQLSFTGSQAGFLLDTAGRVWSTSNGGRTWKQSLSAGTSDISGLSFGSASSGYLSVASFGADTTNAYVLHTSDGGRSWRPQAISPGQVATGGIVASDASHAFSLVRPRDSSPSRQLFFTGSGGDSGAPSPLKIKATPSKFTKRTLKSSKGKVTISGTLAGAVGGEQVTISARAINGVDWTSRTVTAGANGGSYSATFNIKNPAVFVAQWAGDSGRNGAGTSPLTVKVTK
jgi:photosystem II stability/assembly factor-like uncharacterized protein